jgi:hypothetical protein
MSYPTVEALQQQWDLFESAVMKLGFSAINYLPEIKKLMTAVSVVDLSLQIIQLRVMPFNKLLSCG